MDGLVFNESPILELGTNLFINVHVVLQFETIPLISVEKRVRAGYEIEIPIFYRDGTKLAKVKGAQIYLTPAGRKVGVTLRYPQGKTICEMAGAPVFEIQRSGAAALRTSAELYTPDGSFIKCSNESMGSYVMKHSKPLRLGQLEVKNLQFEDYEVCLWVRKSGSIQIKGPGTMRGRKGGGHIGRASI